MEQLKLKDIAEMSAGFYRKPERLGNVHYIQMRDIDNDGKIRNDLRPTVNWDKEKNFLNENDVLFNAKGSKNTTLVYNGIYERAIPSSSFIVLKNIDRKMVLPQYLAWFLNHQKSQTWFQLHAKGSGIPSLSKALLSEFEVDVPNLKTQQQIVELNQLWISKKQLTTKIVELNEKVLNQKLLNAIKK